MLQISVAKLPMPDGMSPPISTVQRWQARAKADDVAGIGRFDKLLQLAQTSRMLLPLVEPGAWSW